MREKSTNVEANDVLLSCPDSTGDLFSREVKAGSIVSGVGAKLCQPGSCVGKYFWLAEASIRRS